MKRFPPIPVRDSGGSFTINNPDDGTPIKEMVTLGDGLLMITEKCTYRLQVADQVDPKRENPALPPNFQQKLFDYGVKSELLCRTFLQAKVMFRKEFQTIDVEQAKQLALDALGALIAMDEDAKAFQQAEDAALEKAGGLPSLDLSMSLPSIGNVRDRCKEFVQKVDHFVSALLGIVRLFYPDMEKKKWTHLQEKVLSLFEEHDPFCKFINEAVPILKLMRDTRNCLEHINHAGVQVTDFALQADGKISAPSIAVDYDWSHQERCAVSGFMGGARTVLLDIFESLIIYMCDRNMTDFAGMRMHIGRLPQNVEDAWHVRYAYGSNWHDGQFIPCG